jgi:diaminopimelate decarboxylase
MSHVEIVGMDCHIGSQITNIAPFRDAMLRLMTLIDSLGDEDIVLKHLDIGGGIGVRYQDESTIDLDEYAKTVLGVLDDRPLQLVFEPGRYITANAGMLLSRIITLKENEGRQFAVTDAAMNDLIRPALYSSWQEVLAVNPVDKPALTYDFVGPVCETGDFLARQRQMYLEEGFLVAIASAGAYGFVMSSNYNSRGRAAEIVVDGNQAYCARQRETLTDQLRLEHVIPD